MTQPDGGPPQKIYVLHLDDEPDIADLAVEFIQRQDDRLDVEPVTSASEALKWLGKNTVHCIVSDFDMPGKNGIEFLEAVRIDYPELPFILYTGKGSEEVASEAISAGVTDYLQKETGISQYEVLANRIKNAVSQYHNQRELNRSRDLLEHTEQLADVGGWEADAETGQQRWTPGTYRIHDLDPDSEFDPTVDAGVEFYHPDDQDEIERLVERCVELGEEYETELRLCTADDRLRWVRATGVPIRKNGEIVAARGAIRDITESKEDEQEIVRLNQLHQTVLSNIRETVLLTDDDGQFTYICPNVHFVFGYDVEEVRELGTVETLFGERLIESDGLGPNGEVTNIETTITDSAGDDHTVLVTVRQVKTEEGARLYSVREITERKEQERALQQRNRELEAVLDNVEAAIWIRDLDSRFKLINQNCRELFGLAEETEVVGKRPADIFPEEVAAEFRENDQQVIETEEPVEIHEEIVTEQGLRTFLTRITPLFDNNDELEEMCGVASDITAQ